MQSRQKEKFKVFSPKTRAERRGANAENIVMWSLEDNAFPKDIQIRFVSVIKF